MKTIGQRIVHLRDKVLDLTQEEFAAALGISRGAVGNWERDKPISRKSVEAIAAKWDVPLDWLLSGRGGLSGESGARQPDVEGFDRAKTMRIPVRGEVAAGQWLETVPFLDDIELDDWLDGLAVPEGMKPYTYALRVKGSSINRLAPDGTFLVCLDITSGIEIHHRDVVIVERIRDQGALREVTAKRLLQRGDEIVLMPESDDPAWQTEIVLKDDPYQMDAEIRVVAKVKHVVRPL